MVISIIGFSLSAVPAAHVGVFESAFVPSQLQIATALFSICALWKVVYLLRVRICFELFLNTVKSKGDLALS